ncbi:MAG: chorismate-binding protein [Candidatus Nitrosocaldus sp.]|nr:chorismate-binding protein [Candidatus Nitrosocaldus sp.]MDW8000121.1 chorismate-binding protein [Candidatus Nitrosocaldus sp.]
MDIFGTDTVRFRRIHTSSPPFDLFSMIYSHSDHVFLLESLTGPREMAEVSIIGFRPYARIYSDAHRLYVDRLDGSRESYSLEEVDALAYIRSVVPRVGERRFRYVGGAVGYVCYDAIRYWERLDSRMLDSYPYMEFCIYRDGIIFDHIGRSAYYFYMDGGEQYDDMLGCMEDAGGSSKHDDRCYANQLHGFSSSEPRRNMSKERFMGMVERAKEYIYSGDIYQVVLSKRFEFSIKGDALPFYSMLRHINPSPYMYYLKVGERCIVGSSPEMLVRVTGDTAETFPIAGTRRVVDDEHENSRLRDEMLRDEKEVAEHTMLVDLARNDLGRVCRWGTVKVNELMAVKRFSHVQHMVSHVTGTLRDDCDAYEAFRAVFPAGTVSGAPKIRAMEIIDELEPVARGPYAGAVGYFSSNGNCDFAIAIRSMFINGSDAYLQSGAGIVADSIPENEWAETEHKADALLEALRRVNAG